MGINGDLVFNYPMSRCMMTIPDSDYDSYTGGCDCKYGDHDGVDSDGIIVKE